MTGQQLKNSILQMAVQGKLVPQDPNDEPASVLLERIRIEKEQLIKEGKIKKDKNPSYIFRGDDNLPYEKVGENESICIADEVPFEIPESWEWVRLGEIFQHNTGKALNASNRSGELLTYITTSNLYWNRFELESLREMYFSESEIEKCTATMGDLLVCEGGDIGRAAIWPYDTDIRIQNHIHRLRFYSEICTEYYYYIFFLYKHAGWIGGKGIGIQGLSANALHSLLFPLPPLSEQYRIISKIKELEPFLDKYAQTEKRLNSLNSQFPDLLKKSILQEAVQGKLVRQDLADEPASLLLERIRAEKEQLIKAGKIKRDKHESVIFRRDNSHYEKLDGIERCIDDEIPFEIPENWCWTRLGTMIGVQRGASPRPKGSPEYWSSKRTPHHWIKISDITKYTQNDELYDTDEFLTDLGTTKSVYVDSDYLITAASGSLGKIAKLNVSGYIYDGLMCMCFKNTSLEMDYIIILIQAMVEYLMSLSTGTAWKNITTDILKNLLVPLPPLSEQRRIVEKQQELFDMITLIQRGIV